MDGGGTNEYLTNPQLACLWDGMFTRFWWTDDWLAGLGGSGGVHGHGGTLHSAFFLCWNSLFLSGLFGLLDASKRYHLSTLL